MCGIAGSWYGDRDPWVADAVERLRHRGPDWRWTEHAQGVTHGHTRLAILDLDARSNQPFRYGRALLSYSGECWNYRSLRYWLEDKHGYVFQTEGDTEVVAAVFDLYIREELDLRQALLSLDGQFALAVTDTATGATWLARDPLGELPLYIDEGREDLFGSARIRWASERKAWAEEERGFPIAVPAGSVWRLGDPRPESYWQAPAFTESRSADLEQLEELLRAAVRKRLQADVPVAFLASGGLDSTLILRLALDEGADVTAFTAGLHTDSPDVIAAGNACREMGVKVSQVQPASWDMTKTIRHAIRTIEITMKAQVEIAPLCVALARAISGKGYKVILSGEGADELFGGYGNLMRKATTDLAWVQARRASVEKMARGNCVRTNKSFMAHGVEARLPFLDRDLVEYVLPMGTRSCPPGKVLLKQLAQRVGVPQWVIDQNKRTFQGAGGTSQAAEEVFNGTAVRVYNEVGRELFGGVIPRG